MERVIGLLNELVREKIVSDYAIGGATALLFYSTPTFTEDIDVFIILPGEQEEGLLSLEPLFEYCRDKHGTILEGQYMLVFGFPIQFLPVYDDLSEDALKFAQSIELQGVKARIFTLEYLMALMIQLGKEKYMERLRLLLLENKFDTTKLESILKKHNLGAKWAQIRNRLQVG